MTMESDLKHHVGDLSQAHEVVTEQHVLSLSLDVHGDRLVQPDLERRLPGHERAIDVVWGTRAITATVKSSCSAR